jgi:hypothetical protein
VEIEENCERFAASTKRKFLSLTASSTSWLEKNWKEFPPLYIKGLIHRAADEKSDRFVFCSNICYKKWTLNKVN